LSSTRSALNQVWQYIVPAQHSKGNYTHFGHKLRFWTAMVRPFCLSTCRSETVASVWCESGHFKPATV